MRRILSSLMALMFMLAVGGSQALAMDKMDSMTWHHGMKCAKGSSWVHGHISKKTGKMTRGYCRKNAMMMKKM